MGFDVITFGSAVVDVFVDTDISEKKGFMCYSVGSKILLKSLRFEVGGGGTNTAVAFSRLGLRTGFIGRIGDDNHGEEILDLLNEEKIKFLGRIEEDAVSGYSIILDSKENNRTILTYKGINDKILFRELNLRKIKTKWIYYSSMMDKSFETQKKLASFLVKKGVKLAFNPSMYLIKKKNLISLLKLCEVLILNKEEAEVLCKKNKIKINSNSKDLLRNLSKLGPRIVVITDKNKLVRCYDGRDKKGRESYLKPHKMKVIERTGAGDAFASGFVAGLIVDKPIEYCLSLGLAEGEGVIKHFGAKNKLLRMKIK